MFEYWCPVCKNEVFESCNQGETFLCKCGESSMILMPNASDVNLTTCPTCCGSAANVYTGEDCKDCAGTGFQPNYA